MIAGTPGPTQVLTLVFLAWTAGTIVFAVWTRLWGAVQPGHFKVMWLVATVLAFAGGFGYHPSWIVAAGCLLTFFAIYRTRDRELGFVCAAGSIAALGADAPIFGLAVAALLGAVTNAMLLGHWHLNQPRLGTEPIKRLVFALWVSVVLFAAACVALLVTGKGLVLLGAGTALAFAVFAGVLTAMVTHLVRTRSIMSATGILYLEILLCFVAAFTGSLAALAR